MRIIAGRIFTCDLADAAISLSGFPSYPSSGRGSLSWVLGGLPQHLPVSLVFACFPSGRLLRMASSCESVTHVSGGLCCSSAMAELVLSCVRLSRIIGRIL
jgi:hypothetical protein